MATGAENQHDDHQEPRIPVFTVSKNGAILKNIFVVNVPPQPHAVSDGYEPTPDQNVDETLLVGRHPDCDIMLTHPSISRFHLQIYSNPVLQKLFVVDLSSVHGTWVSGKRLEARVRVEMKEGDTLRVGASSRAYTLSWVPLARAYDMENPFESELDMAMAVAKEGKKEEQNASSDEPNALEMAQEIQSLDSILEGLDLLFSEGHASETYMGEVLSTPHMQENDSALLDKENTKNNFAPECDEQVNDTLRKLSGSYRKEVKLDSHVGVLNMEVEEKRFETAPKVVTVHPQSQYLEGSLGDSGIKMEEEEKLPYPTDENTEKSSFPVLEEAQQNEDIVQILENVTSKLSPDSSIEESSCDERERLDFLLSLKMENSDNRIEVDLASGILEEPDFCREIMENTDIMDTMVLGSESFANENSSSKIGEGIPETEIVQAQNGQTDIALQPLLDDTKKPQTGCEEHKSNSESCVGERHTVDDAVQEAGTWSISKKDEVGLFSLPPTTESVRSSSLEGTTMRTLDSKQNETLKYLNNLEGQSENENLEISPAISAKKSNSIWSRRGKVISAPHVQTCCSSRITSKGSKVSAEFESMNKKSMADKEISKALFSSLEVEEEEIFTPDKENFTPKTLQLRLLQKEAKLKEIKDLKPHKVLSSSDSSCKACSNVEDMTDSSDKENQTPKVVREKFYARPPSVTQIKLENEIAALKNGVERVPFQSLQVNSPSNSNSVTKVKNSALKAVNSSDLAQAFDKAVDPSKRFGKQNRTTWDIVVDTSSLMDKESRRSLQLIQGLRGTRLIVPRTVIRELDCMNRQGSLFRRTSEASLALEWIEGCMVDTNWWIRVQSSVEEGSQIAPTPPATPLSQLCDIPSLTATSATPSSCNILQELVSPTAEDYILDYTLLWRKKNNNGRTVILSNDVILKIKAMAEGLICETAEDFRESLVNPFSDRFLWPDSCCPRGQTWSYLDDVVLRDRYHRLPLKKPLSKGEAARGLKLILLHNSHYGQVSQRRA